MLGRGHYGSIKHDRRGSIAPYAFTRQWATRSGWKKFVNLQFMYINSPSTLEIKEPGQQKALGEGSELLDPLALGAMRASERL